MINYFLLTHFRLAEGEVTYKISQSFYEQNNSDSDNGSWYFMNAKTLEFINGVSVLYMKNLAPVSF